MTERQAQRARRRSRGDRRKMYFNGKVTMSQTKTIYIRVVWYAAIDFVVVSVNFCFKRVGLAALRAPAQHRTAACIMANRSTRIDRETTWPFLLSSPVPGLKEGRSTIWRTQPTITNIRKQNNQYYFQFTGILSYTQLFVIIMCLNYFN